MIVDTSVLIAILLHEPSRQNAMAAIRAAESRSISAMSLLETGMILRSRLGQPGEQRLYRLLEEMSIDTVPFDGAQARAAIGAFARFGKGMGHRAQLNFGDCAVYALTAIRGETLLATGNDFAATDLTVVCPGN